MSKKIIINTQAEFDSTLQYTANGALANVILVDYIIKCQITLPSDINIIRLNNCEFKTFIFRGSVENSADFYDCDFLNIDLTNANFKGKTRFNECDFYENDFDNTSFLDLADFWSSTFHRRTIFYKVDFFKATVFSNCIFEENALFTYSVITNLLILRQATFKKGLDLSLSVLSGELGLFDLNLENYSSINKKLNTDDYSKEIRHDGGIPLKNKQETFRILNSHFKKIGSIEESIQFRTYERNSLQSGKIAALLFPITFLPLKAYEHFKPSQNKMGILDWQIWSRILNFKKMLNSFLNRIFKVIKSIRSYFVNLTDLVILLLSKISNNHGKSYVVGIFFTLFVGALFLQLSIINTQSYAIVDNFSEIKWSNFTDVSKYYFQSLLPTHKFTYMDDLKPNNRFYLYDFIGRIFIGYGIYQTIQAFRKYR